MSDRPPTHGLGVPSDDSDLLDQLLREEGATGMATGPVIQPRARGTRVPLSFGQELLWLLDQSSPGLSAYNISVARRLIGPLNVDALERALSAVVSRHEVLRTRYGVVDGEPSQLVDPPAFQLARVNLRETTDEARDAELKQVLKTRADTPFDLARDHLFRAALVRLTDTDHVLLLDAHHSALDGWSLGVLMRDIATYYRAERRGAAADVAPLPIQYGDYAIWQRETMQGERLARLLDFWRANLADATETLDLPTDFAAPAAPTYAGARVRALVPANELARIKALAREHGATLYMTLLAAYATVLHRYSGREHVLIGSGVAGRMEPETQAVIGYFNNLLVQHADFTGDPTFAELLGRVRDRALTAFDHQEVPLEKLITELRAGQERLGSDALFRVVFTMQEALPTALELDEIEARPFGVETSGTKFDITLLPFERNGELIVSVHFRSDLFATSTLERFVGHLRRVLRSAVENAETRVSALPMLTDDETAALAAANATDVDEGRAATLVDLFEAQVARVSSRVAVVGPMTGRKGTATLSYAELNARANQVALELRSRGIGRGTFVCLALDRSVEAIVALLGVLKSGAAYVPMTPDTPAPRIAQLLEQSAAKAVITSSEHVARFPASASIIAVDRDAEKLGALSTANPEKVATPADVAYVLFTSGSTGTPKGVAVTHANVVHYARAISRVLGDVPPAQAGDGFAALDGFQFGLVSTLAADLGNTSLIPALLSGGTLHVLGHDASTEPDRFAQYAREHPLDVLKITPNHLAALVAGRTGSDLAAVLPRRWAVLGGEALRAELARTLLSASQCRVLNHYGPTETTVGVCSYEVTSESLDAAVRAGAQTVPIGRPLSNTRAWVVDAHGNLQPCGVPGELLLGGAGVAQGYLGRADLTVERFVEFGGGRAYRTGDRVRRLSSGAIEFLGRNDDQVKIRGYRVEPGDVEHVVRSSPDVGQCVVVARDDEQGNPSLVAYVVWRRDGYAASHAERPSPSRLTEWLAGQLPPHMVPAAVVPLEAIPLTANGKVDRDRLPALSGGVAAAQRSAAPTTETELQLCTIWREVLKKDAVGIRDNFFDLGGHSLLAIRILGRISKTFGVRLALRNLFEAPTVEQLAQTLDFERRLAALENMSEDAAAQLLASTDHGGSPPQQ